MTAEPDIRPECVAMRAGLRAGLAGTALLAVAITAACTQTATPAVAPSTPAPSASAAAAIAWQPCPGSVPDQYKARYAQLECGLLKVPVDYANPSGDQMDLVAIRVKAAGDRLGSSCSQRTTATRPGPWSYC